MPQGGAELIGQCDVDVKWDIVAQHFSVPAAQPATPTDIPHSMSPPDPPLDSNPVRGNSTSRQSKKRQSPEQDYNLTSFALVVSGIGNNSPSSPSPGPSESSSDMDEHRSKRDRLSDDDAQFNAD